MSSSRGTHYLVSVISDNPQLFFEHLPLFEKSGIKGLHFDVMDGQFVPRLGLYPELLAAIRSRTNLFIEVHMMLEKPSSFLKSFVESGADRVIFHAETEENLDGLIGLAQNLSVEVGIALNPATPITSLFPYLDKLDSVLLMAINPGVPKHPFLESTWDKISSLKSHVSQYCPKVEIVIDGGVTFSNHLKLLQIGADKLICGSGTIFHSENSIKRNLKLML